MKVTSSKHLDTNLTNPSHSLLLKSLLVPLKLNVCKREKLLRAEKLLDVNARQIQKIVRLECYIESKVSQI